MKARNRQKFPAFWSSKWTFGVNKLIFFKSTNRVFAKNLMRRQSNSPWWKLGRRSKRLYRFNGAISCRCSPWHTRAYISTYWTSWVSQEACLAAYYFPSAKVHWNRISYWGRDIAPPFLDFISLRKRCLSFQLIASGWMEAFHGLSLRVGPIFTSVVRLWLLSIALLTSSLVKRYLMYLSKLTRSFLARKCL